LGVGEYSYQYGISQWLIFGLPYYVFALIFAWFLAGKVRSNKALTIPEAMEIRYGKRAGQWSAVLIFLLVNPAPYILMLGLLLKFMTGAPGDATLYAAVIALFAVGYISFSGFKAVVRTDILQVLLMFSGFIILFGFVWHESGSITAIWATLPAEYRDITGGQDFSYILVWFFIALWTFVDPGFHQRAAAAESPQTARNGIIASVGLWFVFDFLTVSCGLYSFHILGGSLENPVLAYPALAASILPVGLLGVFLLALIATIMSTLDSFLFLSGQSIGRDLLHPLWPNHRPNTITRAEANIEKISTVERDSRFSIVNLQLNVRNRVHLARVMRHIRLIKPVEKVTRVKSRKVVKSIRSHIAPDSLMNDRHRRQHGGLPD